jgi:hypothetical protein
MTEAEWLACAQPEPMLSFLADDAGERKVRLFLVACARRDQARHLDNRSIPLFRLWGDAIEAGERYADGFESLAQCEVLRHALLREATMCPLVEAPYFADVGRAVLAWSCMANETTRAANACCELAGWNTSGAWGSSVFVAAQTAEKREQSALLRDIFGNPFRPVAFSPAWRTDTAIALARQMYEAREFGAMPILADALQDAGCDNDDVLSHCRDANATHVRGCWVVDLVLGKE